MLAKAELYVQLAQRIGVITKIIQALFLVAEGDICPQRGKHGDARFVLTPAPMNATFCQRPLL